jgi:hypothetical protein
MSPVEAVARAICLAFYSTEWEQTSEFRQGICMGLARAALTALRDNGVTKGMADAGRGYWNHDLDSPHDQMETWDAIEVFRAMLDAALGEG